MALRVEGMRDGGRKAELGCSGFISLSCTIFAARCRLDLDVHEQAQAVADVQPAARIVGGEATKQWPR